MGTIDVSEKKDDLLVPLGQRSEVRNKLQQAEKALKGEPLQSPSPKGEVQKTLYAVGPVSRVPRGFWSKTSVSVLVERHMAGLIPVEQVLDPARDLLGFRPSLGALAAEETRRRRKMGARMVPSGALTVTLDQVRKAHALAVSLSGDVFEVQQLLVGKANELAEFIASLDPKGGVKP